MTSKKFKIIDGPVSVRTIPAFGNTKIGELPAGIEIEVDANSRTEAAGYVWWKHGGGWSAERKVDGSYIIMQEVPSSGNGSSSGSGSAGTSTESSTESSTETPTDTPTETAPVAVIFYKVIDGPVSVRHEPRLAANRLGEIALGTIIKVDSTSRAEFDGYIWWKHDQGWSAERKIDGSYIILQLEPTPPDESGGTGSGSGNDGTTTAEPVEEVKPAEPREDLFFRVTIPVSVRSIPSLAGARVGQLNGGAEITNTGSERVDADGYRWRRHSAGWSVQKKLDDSEVYMERIEALGAGGSGGTGTGSTGTGGTGTATDPNVTSGERVMLQDGTTFTPLRFFTRTPVNFTDIMWIQYFGNSTFAQRIYAEGKRWYKYSQYLHGGFDYGNSRAGTPIYAGVTGRVVQLFRNASVYSPNYLQVAVDNYLIIYGHLANPPEFSAGQTVQPDTIVGYMDAGGQNHLHLEVRYKSWWIINPLLVMTDEVRDPILNKYTNLPQFFYSDGGWNKWVSPFDQPVLRLTSQELGLGPHFR